MTLAVFEINDSGIGHGSSADNWQHSPGFALLDKNDIITGQAARDQAWLQPQRSFQHYWHQLNLSPLSHHNNSARHHADLAYAQLQQLYLASDKPDQVVLAVPGSFSREQLSLLLGLVKASSFSAVGLMDSAVAAVSHQPPAAAAMHLDMQLHQSVVTHLQLEENGELHSTSSEPINGLGLKALLDHWAHYVADQFIRQYRYDPLHTANGEQQLYDKLPEWLSTLHTEPQLTVSLDTAKGNFSLNLLRDEMLAKSESRLQQLQQAVEKLRRSGEQLYVSHRVTQLPGVAERLGEHLPLPDTAVLEGCRAYREQICTEEESLNFVTALQVGTNSVAESSTTSANGVDATHVLIDHRALAIADQLGLRLSQQGVERCSPDQADLCLSINGSGLQIQARPGAAVEAPEQLQAGSIIRLQDQQIRLIKVEL